MKKLMFIALVALFAVSCGGNKNKAQNESASTESEQTAEVKTFKLEELLADAENLVDQTVIVRGFVTHTCKHSGKRCFIVGEDPNVTLRIEAKGNIGGFNRELTGSEISVTGTLRERRLTQEYLEQMEEQAHAKKNEENGDAESCEAELANIEGMKAAMKDAGKDYYSIYYLDGEEYGVIE